MRTVRVTLRPRSTVASQQTTRQAWANATGQFAFRPYDTIRSSAQVPEVFRKRSQWRTDSGREDGNYSHTEEEPNLFLPVEIDSDHYCWVEIQWITEPETSVVADHWQVFQTAREELGLDITIEERDQYVTDEPSTPGSFRAPLITSTPITRAPSPATSTSSRPSIINLFPDLINPQTQEIIHLAEVLHISNDPMSQTITMQAQVGTINPNTGHMVTEDDIAVNRAIGPDRADPPSGGQSRRPYGGGLPVGGPPGGGQGPPGGGGNPPGGGGSVGSPGVHLAPLPGLGAPRGSDKLIGNPPSIL